MYRILTASKDTYITNKIIDNSFRATDANVGEAGTLDLFKLYDENKITGETTAVELSKILIKFPISEVAKMDTDKLIDIGDPSFKCYINLHDVYGGQTTPSNFEIIVLPLAKDFDEGIGRDIVKFSDLGSTNFITASYISNTVTLWNEPGAEATGSLGQSGIDAFTSGTLESGVGLESLSSVQFFEKGDEDLYIDVTKVVSGTVLDVINDKGFIIAFSGSYEKDDRTYFVKRFASRNASVVSKRPKMIIKFDDNIQDNHEDFIFNVTSSLYLRNYHYGNLSNIIGGGSNEGELSGNDCLKLKIESGSFKKIFNVSQIKRGRHAIDGIYSASFAVSSFESLLKNNIYKNGFIKFNEVWTSSDEKVTYLSSSLTIKRENRGIANNQNQNNLLVTVLNVNDEYQSGEKIKVRVFAEDRDRDIKSTKEPLEKKSEIFHEMYYRIRDDFDGSVLIDFDINDGSTRLSSDSSGMFFEVFTDSLPKGRIYSFDFLIRRNSINTIIRDVASKFKII